MPALPAPTHVGDIRALDVATRVEEEWKNFVQGNCGHKEDILEWWRTDDESQFPLRARSAIRRLGLPASQVDVERIFSLCGITVSDMRNALGEQRTEELVVTQDALLRQGPGNQ